MKSSILCVVLIALCIGLSEAWWGSRRSSSRSSSSSSSSSKPKEKSFVRGFIAGSRDMLKSYNEMKKANTIGADKYFHAKGNYKAAQHGPGGRAAARIISNARERIQSWTGSHADDTAADQEANRWGRNGGDPNKYRPRGLDSKY